MAAIVVHISKKLPCCSEQRGIEQIVFNTEGKPVGNLFNSDRWSSNRQILLPELQHHIGKAKAQ
jgi:hypothetical protein